MQVTRWNRKRVVGVGIFLFVLYAFISSGYNTYQIDGIIRKTSPEDVWEFIADFSKMKDLNPTISDFKITSDTGDIRHWKYSVLYKEKLSHWPYWENWSNADYSVRKQSPEEGGKYLVESKHKTCFFGGLYCLKSEGEFKLSGIGPDTYCIETVYYQCPMFLGIFCRREVEYQRHAIMANLTTHFRHK